LLGDLHVAYKLLCLPLILFSIGLKLLALAQTFIGTAKAFA
jgi:hypothetical protein